MFTPERPSEDRASLKASARVVGACIGTMILVGSLVACSGGEGASTPAKPSRTTTTEASADATSDDAQTTTSLPSGPVGEQAQWVLDLLGPEAVGPPAKVAKSHFSAEFLARVPPNQVGPVFDQLRSKGPFTVVDVTPVQTEEGMSTARIRLSGEEALVMAIAVDGEEKIAALLFQPDPEATPVPTYGSFDEMSKDLDDLGTAQVFVGTVTGDRCASTYESPTGAGVAPSGSVFKLVVLSAVVDAIDEGELTWDDELVITEKNKSLPSGRLQEQADGSSVTVREAAGLMISISDNTAADLLLAAVGAARMRESVEALDLQDPSLRPFLSTRQFFLLGWDAPEAAKAWSKASPAERERLLDQLPEDFSGLTGPAAVTTPVWDQGVGWFFTGGEICGVQARLQEQARSKAGEPVREILSTNPGVPVPDGIDYLAFKGGAAPGVIAFSFLVEPASGPTQVLVVQVRNSSAIDASKVISMVRGGLELLR